MQIRVIITLLSLFCNFPFLTAKAQVEGGFTLTGQLKGLGNGTKVYLMGRDRDTISEAISNNENFIFRGKLPNDGKFCFVLIDGSRASKVSLGAIFLENKPIFVRGTVGLKNSLIVKGSLGHQEYIEFLNLMEVYTGRKKEIGTAMAKISRAIAQMNGVDSNLIDDLKGQKKELQKKFRMTNEERTQTIKEWIESHSGSLYAPMVISMIGQSLLGVKGAQGAYNRLTPQAKSSYYGSLLKKDLIRMDEVAMIKEDAIIPNFKIKSSDGKDLFIHDIASKSRFTLIDFWASWCSPCRAEIPALKKLYADFKDKGLNIVGISSDNNEADWRKAMAQDSTLWVHGIQDKQKAVSKLFDLKAIPAYILIDNEGKILVFDCAMSGVKSFGGRLRGEAGYKRLSELIK